MDKKQQILHYYRVEGLGLREISRRVSLDRKTVRRIVRGYESALLQDSETGIEDYLSTVPHPSSSCTEGRGHQRNRPLAERERASDKQRHAQAVPEEKGHL